MSAENGFDTGKKLMLSIEVVDVVAAKELLEWLYLTDDDGRARIKMGCLLTTIHLDSPSDKIEKIKKILNDEEI